MKRSEEKISKYTIDQIPLKELPLVLEALIVHFDLELLRQETKYNEDEEPVVFYFVRNSEEDPPFNF